MTQQSVEILIGKLLTDEELREAFEQDPHEVLAWLLRQGLQLSRLEIEALKSIKPSDLSGLADMIDRRLQKASLKRVDMTHPVHDTDTLPTAPLGTTGMQITRVGFGAWAIGGGGWTFAWGNQDDADSIGAIRHAVERGINWIDTAAVYGLGHSEEIVARALRDIPADDRPYVFTKAGLVWDDHNRPAPPRRVGDPLSIRREVEASPPVRCSRAPSRGLSPWRAPPNSARMTGAPALPTLRASDCDATSPWRTPCGQSRSGTARRSPQWRWPGRSPGRA